MFKIGFNVHEGSDVFLVCTVPIKEMDTSVKYEHFVHKGNSIHSKLRQTFDGVYFGGSTNVQKDRKNYIVEFVMKIINNDLLSYFSKKNKLFLSQKKMEEFMAGAPYQLWSLVALKDECKRRGLKEKDYSKVTNKSTLIALLEAQLTVTKKSKMKESKMADKKGKKKSSTKSADKKTKKDSTKKEVTSFDGMTSKEVRKLARSNGIKPKGKSKDQVIKILTKKGIKPGSVSSKQKENKKENKAKSKGNGNGNGSGKKVELSDMTLTALRKLAKANSIRPKGMSLKKIVNALIKAGVKSGNGESGNEKSKSKNKSKKSDKSDVADGNNEMTLTALRKLARSKGLKPKGKTKEQIMEMLGKNGNGKTSKKDNADKSNNVTKKVAKLVKKYKAAKDDGNNKVSIRIMKKIVGEIIEQDGIIKNRAKKVESFRNNDISGNFKEELTEMKVWNNDMKYLPSFDRYFITKQKNAKDMKAVISKLLGSVKNALILG